MGQKLQKFDFSETLDKYKYPKKIVRTKMQV